MSDPCTVELAKKLAALEERMKTMQAEYKTDIARLAEAIARRDRDNTRWMVGLWAAAVVLIITVLGFLIRAGA